VELPHDGDAILKTVTGHFAAPSVEELFYRGGRGAARIFLRRAIFIDWTGMENEELAASPEFLHKRSTRLGVSA
jgi:hypothetical protein